MTICFLVKEGEKSKMVCLAEKKRGFRVGKINGYGGKIEQGESIEECAIRETYEESGVKAINLRKHAEITYFDPNNTFECHVFVIDNWEGEPVETEEMDPSWYNVTEIPFDRMGKTDHEWLLLILEGQKVKANFYFDSSNLLSDQSLRILETF